MRFSRNPASGELEAYTDDGVYVGIISTMGDAVSKTGTAEDGGPGSGNWGHKGRPGKKGGSGKGGGKAMRTGSKESGYTSFAKTETFARLTNLARKLNSRGGYSPSSGKRDFWQEVKMNKKLDEALKAQHKAVSPNESYSDYVDRMYDMLSDRVSSERTAPKVEEVMKSLAAANKPLRDRNKDELTMSAIQQRYGSSPTKIMNNPFSTKDKSEFLRMIGERTGWGSKMVDRRFRGLTAQEKKDMNAMLDAHPWDDDPKHAKIPSEEKLLKSVDQQTADYYCALKAKALGIGGVYVPDRPDSIDKMQPKRESPIQAEIGIPEPKAFTPQSKDEIVERLCGSESYMLNPKYKDALEKVHALQRDRDQASKEWNELDERMKEELLPEFHGFSWEISEDDLTEKGKELYRQRAEKWEQVKELDSELPKASDRLKSFKTKARQSEMEAFNPEPLEKATQEQYEGFSLDTGVPDMQERLKNGEATIAEMSPREYLERCAFEIFPNGTLESQIGSADFDNVMKYAEKMRNGEAFNMPYLNYNSKNQEGRHRALAAIINGYEKIPVAIVGRRVQN